MIGNAKFLLRIHSQPLNFGTKAFFVAVVFILVMLFIWGKPFIVVMLSSPS